MTDARLMQNSELLLAWSAHLEEERLPYDQWLIGRILGTHQTERNFDGSFDASTGSSCADASGHSVRV